MSSSGLRAEEAVAAQSIAWPIWRLFTSFPSRRYFPPFLSLPFTPSPNLSFLPFPPCEEGHYEKGGHGP